MSRITTTTTTTTTTAPLTMLETVAANIYSRTGWTGKKLELAVVLHALILAAANNMTEATNHFIARADGLASRDEQGKVLAEMRRAAA